MAALDLNVVVDLHGKRSFLYTAIFVKKTPVGFLTCLFLQNLLATKSGNVSPATSQARSREGELRAFTLPRYSICKGKVVSKIRL